MCFHSGSICWAGPKWFNSNVMIGVMEGGKKSTIFSNCSQEWNWFTPSRAWNNIGRWHCCYCAETQHDSNRNNQHHLAEHAHTHAHTHSRTSIDHLFLFRQSWCRRFYLEVLIAWINPWSLNSRILNLYPGQCVTVLTHNTNQMNARFHGCILDVTQQVCEDSTLLKPVQ